MITVRQMLSLGRDMGLNTVYESWSQIQSHWDAFFSFDKFEEEQRIFNAEMFELGLLERNTNPETKGMYRWPDKDETLVDAMARLGYEYSEPDWDEMSRQSFEDDFEDDISLEEMDDFFSQGEGSH